MIRRSLVILSLVVIVATLISGCSGAAPAPSQSASPSKSAAASSPAASTNASPQASAKPSESPKAPPPPATVRVGIINSATDAPALIAIEKGYLKEQNITVEEQVFDSASKMVAPLAAGQLDIGAGGISSGLYNSIATGIPLKAVATKGDLIKGAGVFMTRKEMIDSGKLGDYATLKGKNIGTNATKATTEYTIYLALKKGGLTLKDATLTEVPFPQMIPALVNGSLDVAWLIEPYITQAKAQGLVVWKMGDEFQPNPGSLVLLYGPDFWQKQDDVAKRFMVAYIKGIRDYLDAMWKKGPNREEIIQILMKKTPLKDRALYDKMTPITYNPDGRVDKQALSLNQDYYLENGYQQQKVDLSKVIDESYVEYALKILGPYKE